METDKKILMPINSLKKMRTGQPMENQNCNKQFANYHIISRYLHSGYIQLCENRVYWNENKHKAMWGAKMDENNNRIIYRNVNGT